MPYKDPDIRRAYNIAYQRVYHRRHKAEHIEKNRVRKYNARTYLKRLKRERPCVECGEADFRCLDFHHSNGHEKLANLSHLATDGATIDRLNRELQKCVVLCKNCHAKEHFKR
jgi:hypothetical protein